MSTPPPHHQGKAIGDSFPMDGNSKTRIVRELREEAGPCTVHGVLISKVRSLP